MSEYFQYSSEHSESTSLIIRLAPYCVLTKRLASIRLLASLVLSYVKHLHR